MGPRMVNLSECMDPKRYMAKQMHARRLTKSVLAYSLEEGIQLDLNFFQIHFVSHWWHLVLIFMQARRVIC